MQCSLGSYGAHEDSNKLSFDQFQAALDADRRQRGGGDGRGLSVEEDVLPQMRAAVAHVFTATLHRMNPARRDFSFELMGFDFMLSADGRVKLLEVSAEEGSRAGGRGRVGKATALFSPINKLKVELLPRAGSAPGEHVPRPVSARRGADRPVAEGDRGGGAEDCRPALSAAVRRARSTPGGRRLEPAG